jgi:ABC-2 type transport system permease protein
LSADVAEAAGEAGEGSRGRLRADDRTFGAPFDINTIGLWTLFAKEVRRFLKVPMQTVLAPVATTLIFLAIFSVALGRARPDIAGVPFLQFLAPGLVMMAIIQNAFANSSSSLVIAKVQGNIVDLVMPPLSPGELVFGLVMGGVARGVMVAVVVYAAMLPFVPMGIHSPLAVAFHVLGGSLLLALLGLLGGLWAEKFDQIAAVTNFVITPLSFLSGTFYSVQQLPESVRLVAYGNPFFYLIDGIRFGVTGHADGPVAIGVAVVVAANTLLWLIAHRLVAAGYRLKA